MRILFLTSAHNSLSQRLWIELGELGHEICICVAATDEAMIAAVSREKPDLIIAPMLKIAIPEEVWSRHLCLIVFAAAASVTSGDEHADQKNRMSYRN